MRSNINLWSFEVFEKLVKAYNQVFNLPYTIIRPSAALEKVHSRRVGQIFIEKAITNNDIVMKMMEKTN